MTTSLWETGSEENRVEMFRVALAALGAGASVEDALDIADDMVDEFMGSIPKYDQARRMLQSFADRIGQVK